MIYLSGLASELVNGIGFIRTPNSQRGALPAGSVWAADNGRFANPESYTDNAYLAWLDRQRDKDLCLFATAPDVLGNHAETVALAMPMLTRIRAFGFCAAFVAQDGFDIAPWDSFDCLFIGGTTSFKLGEQIPGIVAEARKRGKWVHMGRVNSYKRLRVAAAIGCQSADGTFLKFAPDHNAGRMQRWLDRLHSQPFLS